MDRTTEEYADSPLPNSLFWKRRPVEFRLVHVCPRKVRARFLDHWRGPGHTGRSFRNSSRLSVIAVLGRSVPRRPAKPPVLAQKRTRNLRGMSTNSGSVRTARG